MELSTKINEVSKRIGRIPNPVMREKLKSYWLVSNSIQHYGRIFQQSIEDVYNSKAPEDITMVEEENLDMEESIKMRTEESLPQLSTRDSVKMVITKGNIPHDRLALIIIAMDGVSKCPQDFDAWLRWVIYMSDDDFANILTRLKNKQIQEAPAEFVNKTEERMEFLRKPRVTLSALGKKGDQIKN